MSFGELIQKSYGRMQQPLAYALVVAAFVLGRLPYPSAQAAALAALGGIMVRLLFEVRAVTASGEGARHFVDFHGACPPMEESVLERLSRRSHLRLRWLGMTMEHAWPFLERILDRHIRSGAKCMVAVELAMLEPTTPSVTSLNPSWVADWWR